MKMLLLALIFSTQLLADVDPIQRTTSEAVGFYSNGKLLNAAILPVEGNGFMRLFVEHDRGYGTADMINMIEAAASDMISIYPARGRLQIEDIAAPHGGIVNDHHKSHQNGLDADITLYRADGLEHVPFKWGYEYGVPMVENGKVSELFDRERTWQVIKAFHRHGRVQRIFLDHVLKAELCRYTKSIKDFNVEVLRSIRHEENHQDHMHVRLRCPVNDKRCISQDEVPAGSGCPGSGDPMMPEQDEEAPANLPQIQD
jgi:penicillin-insensitive murein endopeptidase